MSLLTISMYEKIHYNIKKKKRKKEKKNKIVTDVENQLWLLKGKGRER